MNEENFLVCSLWENAKNYFSDNLKANCCDCKREIAYRPHAPNLIKICVLCAMIRVKEQG
jgi:hypothetical protein